MNYFNGQKLSTTIDYNGIELHVEGVVNVQEMPDRLFFKAESIFCGEKQLDVSTLDALGILEHLEEDCDKEFGFVY